MSWWLLWALSFGIEAMISVPILEIMAQAATAARLGITVQRTKIVLFEAVLLGSTVGLNSGPHVAAGDLGRAAEFSVAPIMVVVLMWLHAWLTARNAEMIAAITARRTETAARESSAPNNQNIGSITDTADHAATSPGRMAPSPATPHPVHASPVTTIAARASKPVVLTAPYRTVDSPVAASAEFAERPTSHPQAGAAARADTDTITTVAVDPCGEIAEQLVLRKLARKPASQIVALLQLAAQGHNTNHITNQMSEKTATPWARSTVDRIITRAGQLGFDPASVQQEVAA
ncbi:hypothetical protein [Nocardia asiatica]